MFGKSFLLRVQHGTVMSFSIQQPTSFLLTFLLIQEWPVWPWSGGWWWPSTIHAVVHCRSLLSDSPFRCFLSGNLLWKAFGFHQRTVGSRGGSSQHVRPAFHSIRFRVDFLVMSPPSSPVFFFRSQKRETESMTLRRKKLYQPMGTKCRDGLGSVPVFRPWKEKQSIPQFDLVWKENYV